ncbi:MAG TPA: flagellar FlbD family protein [Acidisarcina sp.]|nr:flagellar FlbD family protein [Acidisarcina sp.]
MIELTRLNGNALVINSDLIKFAESSPDTMLTLINGEKIMVRESCTEVIERVIAYRARLLGESMRVSPGAQDGVQRAVTSSAAAALRAYMEEPLARIKGDAADITDDAAQRRRRPEH